MGVSPLEIAEHTRYFATLPINEDLGLEISIFSSLADDFESPAYITRNMFVFHTEESRLMQFVMHSRSRRAKRSRLTADFDGHALGIEETRADYPRPEKNQLWTGHKLGGLPFFYHRRPDILETSDRLISEGWVHLLQMTSLGCDDAPVSGNWPIWNQMFHVFAKEENQRLSVRYIWA